jgi:hypothetical protein
MVSHGAAWKEVVLAYLLEGNKNKKNMNTTMSFRAKDLTGKSRF